MGCYYFVLYQNNLWFVCSDAEVLFDYDKMQDDELNLKVGQIIHNVEEVCVCVSVCSQCLLDYVT